MASKSMRDCRNMQFIKWNLRLGCPALSNTQRQKKIKTCIFWRAAPRPNRPALTGYGLFWARLKSPEKIRPRPYILFGLSARPVRPGPFWQL